MKDQEQSDHVKKQHGRQINGINTAGGNEGINSRNVIKAKLKTQCILAS